MNYKKELDRLTDLIKTLIKEMYEYNNNIICENCKTEISHSLDLINKINCPFCYTRIK